MSALAETYSSIQTLVLPVLEGEQDRLSGRAGEFARLLELVGPENYLRRRKGAQRREGISARRSANW